MNKDMKIPWYFVGIPINGFVVSKLWQWFILPMCPTLPILGIVSGYSLLFTLRFFCNGNMNSAAIRISEAFPESKKFDEQLSIHVGYPLFVLLVGYVLHLVS